MNNLKILRLLGNSTLVRSTGKGIQVGRGVVGVGGRREYSGESGGKEVEVKHKNLLINNEWIMSHSGDHFTSINPSTEQPIADIAEAGDEDVENAVMSARYAFDRGEWSKMTGPKRAMLLHRLADLVEKNAEKLAMLESMDNGKPLSEAQRVDVPSTVKIFRYYAGWADKLTGETIPGGSNDVFTYTVKEPVGVCAQILPWNFPLLLAACKLAPALAAGCVSILKPAEQTPLTTLELGALAVEAGFPAGVVNILPGQGAVGARLARHPLVDKVSFTGSTEVGHKILQGSAESNLKRVSLELGGKSPNIVFPDCDIDAAVAGAHFGLFFNDGQVCTAGSRVFVHAKLYDEFVEKSVKLAKTRVVGDPLHSDTTNGPLVSKEQMDRVINYIEQGKKEGAELATGGKIARTPGYYVEPTVFTNVKDTMAIAKEEIFGPVMSILKFEDTDDVINRANNTKYGLAAGLWTKDVARAHYVSSKLKAGTVWVNCYNRTDVSAPFGGFKQSGIGREFGKAGLEIYTETKTVTINVAM